MQEEPLFDAGKMNSKAKEHEMKQYMLYIRYVCRLVEKSRAEFLVVQEMGEGCTWMFQQPSQM